MNFPKDGLALEIKEWLETENFDPPIVENFVKWNAGAMLGMSEPAVMRKVPGDEGDRLWSLLNTAKTFQRKFLSVAALPCREHSTSRVQIQCPMF
jgi:SAM domain (Sterile alpha motif)